MRDFDDYLDRLRAALDVTPKRADEICKEVRSHLEARAKQLTATGLNAEAAAAEAVREFGEPKHMAAQLTQANSRHRGNLLGAVLGMVVVCFTGYSLAFLQRLNPWFREAREAMIGLLTNYTPLSQMEAGSLLGILAILPAAVLAGMLAGRRRWWIAAAPLVLWFGLMCTVGLLTSDLRPPGLLRKALVSTLIVVLIVAAGGYLGARAAARRRTAWFLGLVCGCYVAIISAAVFAKFFAGLIYMEAWWIIIIVVTELAVILLAAAAYRERRISGQMLRRIGGGVWLAGASLVMLTSVVGVRVGSTIFHILNDRAVWFGAAVAILLAAGAWLLGFRQAHRDSSAGATSEGSEPTA